MKRQLIEWANIFTNHFSDEGFPIQLLNYNKTTSLKNGEVSEKTLHQKYAKSNNTHK
jgi:hypothetical protein